MIALMHILFESAYSYYFYFLIIFSAEEMLTTQKAAVAAMIVSLQQSLYLAVDSKCHVI